MLLVFTLFQGYASLCATYHPTVGLRHVKTAVKAITYLSFVLKFRITLLFASLLLEEFLDQSYCFPRKNIPELRLEFVIENKASYFFKNVQVTFVWYLFDFWFLIFIGLLGLCTIMAKSVPKVYHSYFEFSGESSRAVNIFVFRHL